MAVLYTPHFMQFFANDGTPLAGGKLYTYAAGTTTPKATYTTAAGTIANANPVVLDAYGRAVIFIEGSYRFDLYTSADVLIKSTDNVTSFNASTETEQGFFQSFSGDGATVAFTLSENLGTDENALLVFSETEYTTNGTFASDTGWTKGSGWTIGSGVATASGAISTALEQSAGVSLVQGKAYSIGYTITRSAGSITLSVGGTAGTARSASGTYSETIIAGSTQTISFGTSGFTGTVDNVSVRDVTGPTIKNPNTYTVNGTSLTFATAPATGTNNIYVFAPYTLINSAGAAQAAADAAIAAQAAAEGATNAVAYQFKFDSSTVMGDPGTGDFRLNNATLASVTAIAIDAESSVSGNPDVSDAIATWGQSTNTIKGQIKISKSGTPATFALYNVTSSVADNTGWLQITVTHVDSNGSFSNTDTCYLQFTRSGDVGATGAQGPTGTVSGASSATLVTNDKVLFLDTGTSDALSYQPASDIDVSLFGSGAATDGYVLTADGAGGAAWEDIITAIADRLVPAGTVAAFAMNTPPSSWLECNGSNVSRTTYANLFAAIYKSATVTITIASPGVVSWTGHGLKVNDPVQFTTTGALPTGLSASTTYYVVSSGLGANSFSVSATPGGAAINTTGTQSGTHTGIHAPFGVGDGSTTFTLPDLRGEFVRGWDNSKGTDANRSFGSSQLDALQGHIHTYQAVNTGSTGGGSGNNDSTVATKNSSSPVTDGVNGTPRTAAETRPRSIALMYCIKT